MDREVQVCGRVLTVHEAGAPDGPTILCHHGTPITGELFSAWVEDASARGARLVSYDRPGYGTSTAAPGRAIADAAADCAAIMDSLGVERFVSWGISGGGPHVLACGALLGGRVAAVASLGGVAPFDAIGLNYFHGMGSDNLVEFGLAMAGQEHLEPFLRRQVDHMTGAGGARIAEAIASLVSAPDHKVLGSGLGDFWASASVRAFERGVAGWLDDDLAFVKDFGFDVKDIGVPVLVVHGEQDRFVPTDHGRWLAAAIPGSKRWINADDGHLTLIVNRIPAVHEWLLQHL